VRGICEEGGVESLNSSNTSGTKNSKKRRDVERKISGGKGWGATKTQNSTELNEKKKAWA